DEPGRQLEGRAVDELVDQLGAARLVRLPGEVLGERRPQALEDRVPRVHAELRGQLWAGLGLLLGLDVDDLHAHPAHGRRAVGLGVDLVGERDDALLAHRGADELYAQLLAGPLEVDGERAGGLRGARLLRFGLGGLAAFAGRVRRGL